MQHDFILLDRSGSMSENNLWVEALGAVNGYVKKLADDKVDTGVTLCLFDENGGEATFDVLRDRIVPSTWKDVSSAEATPRGMTPLNDAIAKIIGRAEQGNYEKVAVIIMTDGLENASREFPNSSGGMVKIKALLDKCRAKNWQIIFLGANFDNAAQGSSYGSRASQTVMASAGNLKKGMAETANLRSSFARGASATMDFAEETKTALRKPNAPSAR